MNINRNRKYLLISTAVLITMSNTMLADTVCTNFKTVKSNTPEVINELIPSMDGAIKRGEFDPALPFTVTSEGKRCKKTDNKELLQYTLQPSEITPKEHVSKTITQVRNDGTRTYTYTNLNGVWVLTSYEFVPVTTPEAP